MSDEAPTVDDAQNASIEPKPDAVMFPKAVVKRIMKIDPEVVNISAEAIALVSKATEILTREFAKNSFATTSAAGRSTIHTRD